MDEALWRRVEAALDARRDPLEDPGLRRDLARHPEDLAAVRRLLAGLGHLVPTTGGRRVPRAGVWLVGALAAGLLALALLQRRDHSVQAADHAVRDVAWTFEHHRAEPPRFARVELQPRPVIRWSLEGE